MTTRQPHQPKSKPATPSSRRALKEVEANQEQDRILRLSEYAESGPLTLQQIEVLRSQGESLQQMLGLQLLASVDGTFKLKASQYVGSARFVHNGQHVMVQVQPKIRNADVLKMLDHSRSPTREHDQAVPLYQGGNITLLFLSYFAREVADFLKQAPGRHYSFETLREPGRVKGRPLLEAYIRQSLPRARPHVLPCVYLNYHVDVFENQVIASAVNVALRLTREIAGNGSHALAHQLSSCARQLHGVSIHRISTQDIRRFVYNRSNARYQPIHELCAMILDNRSVSLQTGERVPFFSFAVDMSDLFQSYVAAAFSRAFKQEFSGHRTALTFGISNLDKRIILDGLLKQGDRKIVVECKYKETTIRSTFGQRLLNEDVFQALAYAGYTKIRADKTILVYPIDEQDRGAVIEGETLLDFGWHQGANSALPIEILGINLTSPFHEVVREIRRQAVT